MTASFQSRVAVAGYAISEIARHHELHLGALTVSTALQAVADAGLNVSDIDGFTTGTLLPSASNRPTADGREFVSAQWLAETLGVRPRWASGFQGYGQLPGAVMLAVSAIAAGLADCVLLHRALFSPAGVYHQNTMTEASGPAQWRAPHGLWGPPAEIALAYNEYMHRYGATREEMAAVAVEFRRNGAQRPWSYWRDRPLTKADYLAAPMIADPISRLDCDIPVTGVAAFVLTSAERARDLPHHPVYISGFGQGSPIATSSGVVAALDDIMAGGSVTAQRLWESSGLGPSDVDFPQLYDGFSPLVYFWLEALGYCPVGEAHAFVQDGAIDSGHGLPVGASGGSLGNGRLHGIPQMLECYLQLSGRAGELQRAVSIGLACHSLPHYGGVVLYSRDPLT